MKRYVRTIFFLASIMLSLAMVAAAGDHGICTNNLAATEWGYTLTGTIFVPGGSGAPFATVGKAVFDVDGTISGTQTESTGILGSEDTIINGTWDPVNPDCTMTFSVDIYDQLGNLLRTANWAGVIVDDGKESRSIMTKLLIQDVPVPGGLSVPAVVTMNAKRLFPPPGNSKK